MLIEELEMSRHLMKCLVYFFNVGKEKLLLSPHTVLIEMDIKDFKNTYGVGHKTLMELETLKQKIEHVNKIEDK